MEDQAASIVVEATLPIGVPIAAQEVKTKQRRATDAQVTAFQPATPLPDLLDPRSLLEPQSSSGSSSGSDPNSGSSDPSTGDDSSPSPSSFLGTPYSTSLQFDYPFPISNAPSMPPSQPPSALPIASSLASAPSLITAAASSATLECPESSGSNPLPSMVSTIAASMDTPVNNTLSELRHMSNKSTSSLGSTHSGHSMAPTATVLASSATSTHSISPSSSFQNSHFSQPPPRPRGRHSLTISPIPPPPLALQNHSIKASGSPTNARRPKLHSVSSIASTGSDTSQESLPAPHPRSRPPSGSVSSLSIASLQLLSNPGEPPIPPSLLNKLNKPRNTGTNSTVGSYFSSIGASQKSHNSRDFFGSPTYDSSAASLPSSPPTNLNTDSSSSDFYKPQQPTRAGFFRPQLGRSNSTNTGTSLINRPFLGRSNTTNSQLQSRAYAQHLRHQQEQQLKQEENKKKDELKKKMEKEKEKKKGKGRRSSLSLSRSASGSSASSAKTRASSSTKSKSPSSSNSQTDGFKLSPTQSSLVESAIDESEGSASPEGTKIRRRSSVRRILEKTGALVSFNLSLKERRGGAASPNDGKRSPKRSGSTSPKNKGNVSPRGSGKPPSSVRNVD